MFPRNFAAPLQTSGIGEKVSSPHTLLAAAAPLLSRFRRSTWPPNSNPESAPANYLRRNACLYWRICSV